MPKRNLSETLKRRAEQSDALPSSTHDVADEAYDSLFGSTPIKPWTSKRSQLIPIEKLHAFHTTNIGFKAYRKEDLHALATDIADNGLLENIKVRPETSNPGEYEILSGHNRVDAYRLLGKVEIQADIEYVDDYRATVIATVTNLQRRQGLLPSERGWAYRALLKAQKRQGKRTDLNALLTCAQSEHKSRARDKVAAFFGVDRNSVQREVRLTYLNNSLLNAVDSHHLNLMCGVAISYYDAETQHRFLERLQTDNWKLSNTVMNHIKKACPPPTVSTKKLNEAWSFAAAQIDRKKHENSIIFNRKCFAPYLEKLSNEKELEALFLEFLQSRV